MNYGRYSIVTDSSIISDTLLLGMALKGQLQERTDLNNGCCSVSKRIFVSQFIYFQMKAMRRHPLPDVGHLKALNRDISSPVPCTQTLEFILDISKLVWSIS
jgi:hypothetical protein